jgi:hypothetical protein
MIKFSAMKACFLLCLLLFSACAGSLSRAPSQNFDFETFNKIKLGSKPDKEILPGALTTKENVFIKKIGYHYYDRPPFEILLDNDLNIVEKVYSPKKGSVYSNPNTVIKELYKDVAFELVAVKCGHGNESLWVSKQKGLVVVADEKSVASIIISLPKILEMRLADNANRCKFSK